MIEIALTASGVMLGLAVLFGVLLGLAQEKLAVEVDPRQAEIEARLPQANCGGCGFASCSAYARSVARGKAPIDRCTVGGPPVAAQLAALLGLELKENFPMRPVIHCGAKRSQRLQPGRYVGPPTCSAAHVVGGVQGCTFGCLGFGDCVLSCEYDAMSLDDGLPRINYENCVGCGACVRACPRGIIEQVPFKVERMLVVACANRDPGKAVREICTVGCIGCGACARVQPELFSIENNLAKIDYGHYTGQEDFWPAIEKCPMESLIVFGRPLLAEVDALAAESAVTLAKHATPRPTAEELPWRG